MSWTPTRPDDIIRQSEIMAEEIAAAMTRAVNVDSYGYQGDASAFLAWVARWEADPRVVERLLSPSERAHPDAESEWGGSQAVHWWAREGYVIGLYVDGPGLLIPLEAGVEMPEIVGYAPPEGVD